MLSADITGSTALTERLANESTIGAEQITELLSEIFGQLIEVSAAFGGDVLEFSGDSMLVLFVGSNHEQAAAAAGVKMQHRISSMLLAKEYSLTIRVGAHSDVFDVFLAGRLFKQLIVAGPAASQVVLMESEAGAGNVLASEQLAEVLPTDWRGVRTEDGWRLPSQLPDSDLVASPTEVESISGANRLVNPVIANELSSVDELGGEHRPAAVAFLDVQGIDQMLTSSGGRKTAEAVAAILDASVTSASRYGSTHLTNGVTKEGFKFTLLAGVPTSQGADLEALIRTMLEILATDTELTLRGGVTQGSVFAGFLGPAERHEYAAMGKVVNLAARLLEQASPGELVTTDAVVEQLGEQLETEARPPVRLRGTRRPTVPHRILSIADAPGAASDPMIDDDLLLVGRERELKELNKLVEDIAIGGFAFVGSETGMGAHRLLTEIEVDPDDRVRVRCSRYDNLSAFASIRPALEKLLRIEEGCQTERLEELAGSLDPGLEPFLPLVNPIFDAKLEETAESGEITDLDEIAAKRAEVIVDLLTMNLEGPTMLLVEDLHFVDSASCKLLESIGQASDLPLVTILSGSFEAAKLLSSPPPTCIDIGPIDKVTARRLVDAVAEGRALSDYQINEAVERANGNPLFLIELVLAVINDGELSNSIDAVIRTKIDELPSEDRQLLKVASILGADFELEVLDRLLSKLGHSGWSNRLSSMPHLIEVVGDNAHFTRALYRDVCYNALAKIAREEIHLAAGLLMEESGRTSGSDLGLLALHFDEADDKPRTWKYAAAAGRTAMAAGAPIEAITSFERALKAADGLGSIEPHMVSSIREALGDALFRSGSLKKAARAYAAATRASDQSGTLRLMRQIGTVRERIGKLNAAELWYRRALGKIPQSTESEQLLHHRLQLQLTMTGLRHRQNRHDELSAVARAALKDAVLLGDRASIALAKERILLGTIYSDGPADLLAGEEALKIYRELGDEFSAFKVVNNLAIAYHLSGQWDRALNRYQEASETAQRIGDVIWVGYSHNNRAEIFSNRGNYEAASEELEKASRIWQAASYATGEAAATMNIGLLIARQNHDIRPARQKLQDSIDHFRTSKETYEANEARLRLAEVLLISKLPSQADQVLKEVAAAEKIPPPQEVLLTTLRGYSTLSRGKQAEALEQLRTAEGMAQATGSTYELALIRLAIAAALESEDEAELVRAKANNALVRLRIISPTPLVEIITSTQ